MTMVKRAAALTHTLLVLSLTVTMLATCTSQTPTDPAEALDGMRQQTYRDFGELARSSDLIVVGKPVERETAERHQ